MPLSWFVTLPVTKTHNLRRDHRAYRVMSPGRDQHFRSTLDNAYPCPCDPLKTSFQALLEIRTAYSIPKLRVWRVPTNRVFECGQFDIRCLLLTTVIREDLRRDP